MGQSAITLSLVQNYRQLFVGDTYSPIVTNIDGVGDSPGDDTESYLDIELAGGLAPGANLHFYTASATTDNGVLTSAQYAIDTDHTIDILSLSYGACELENTTSGNLAISELWKQAAAQGITVIVSTGDTGSAACDPAQYVQDGVTYNTLTATGPMSVNGLASTPYNIAVGGTDFDALYNSNGTPNTSYFNTSTPGSPSSYYRTALSYIPEATWNDSTLNNTTIADNEPLTANEQTASEAGIGAGAGGPSNCATNTTTDSAIGACTSGYPKPSWQNPSTISGMPNDQARDIPDVSFLSGTGFYGAFWALCDGSSEGFDDDGNTGTANCVADSSGDFYTDGVGGTSAAAPTFAGIMALIVQKTGQRQGQAAPILYSLYASTPTIFHDVDLGNNSVPCSPSTYNTATCAENTEDYDFMTGYNSNAGYDLATGLGSVDATLLVNAWTSAAGSFYVANVAATPSATTIASNDPLTFTVNVTPLATGGSTPAGSVSVTDSVTGYTSPAVALANGSATITIPGGTLQVSTADVFTISYAPPTTGAVFAPASDFVTVAITAAATPSLTLTGPSIAITPGGSGTSAITVTPGGGFTGTVALTCAVTGPAGATSLPTCALSPTSVTIAGTTAQTSTLSVATSSSTTVGTYTATVTATGTGGVVGTAPIAVTVASAATPTLSVSGPAITITLPTQTTGSSVVTVTPGGGFTGAVNLTCSITPPSGTISPPTCAFATTPVTISGATAATSTLNVTAASTTSVGAYTVNVTAADVATGKVTASDGIALTVGGTPASDTITLGTPTAATVSSPGGSGTSTFSVTTDYSPATINFSCTLASSPSGANASYYPGCSVAAVNITSSTAGTATASFTTTAASSSELSYPIKRDNKLRWYTTTGGAVLACILFFGIPARRRGWRSMLSLLVFLVTMAGLGCGGGGNSNNVQTGTTTGTYTFTVTATDSVTSTITATSTITLTVN